jgi:hypothetical protein
MTMPTPDPTDVTKRYPLPWSIKTAESSSIGTVQWVEDAEGKNVTLDSRETARFIVAAVNATPPAPARTPEQVGRHGSRTGEAMSSNEHPDMSGSGCDDGDYFTPDRMEDAFRAGAAQMREMLARFVEQGGDARTAQSIRANWVPGWGKDPGKQDEIYADLWTTI